MCMHKKAVVLENYILNEYLFGKLDKYYLLYNCISIILKYN